MPQQPALYAKLSVAENLRLFARLEKVAGRRGGGRRACSSRPACATARATRSGGCRGGNQQRVNIAIGLLAQPARAAARRAVGRRSTRASASGCGASSAAWPREGTAVVYSTHDVGEAERYADRVLVLADGELLFTGTPGGARAAPSATRADFEAAFVRFLHERGH